MKSAIVGCGSIASMHAEVISGMKDSRLIAVADIDENKAISFAESYNKNNINTYTSLEDMVENEEIDILHICIPHDLHVPMAVYALEKDIHVLMEKPPAISREQFELLERVKSDKQLGFCFQNRYNNGVKQVKEIFAKSEMGEIVGARAFITWNRPETYYKSSKWKGTWQKEGGGVLINQAIHTLDLLVQFLGKPKWTEASIHNHSLKGTIEVEDTLEAYIEFDKCPVIFYATNAYSIDAPCLIEITCENATIRLEEDFITIIYKDRSRKEINCHEKNIGKSYWGNGHLLLINEFYDKVKLGEKFAVNVESVKDTFSLTMDIYESAKRKDTIMFDKKYKLSGFADEIDPDLDRQISVLQECNMSYLELRSAYGKNISEYSIEEAKELKDRLDKDNIKVSAIGSPIGKISITDDFEEHFKLFSHVVDLAKIFETDYIRIFSFYIPQGKIAENYKDEVFRRLKRMTSYAKDQNIILLHENEKGIYGDTANRCKEIAETLYSDNFKLIFDFANFIQSDQDTLEAFKVLRPYIAYIHIKDALKENHKVVPAGMGDGHISEIVNLLKVDNYNGFYSLEPHLHDFEGLKELEREGEESAIGNDMNDGRVAFMTAYKAFIEIMEG